MNEASKWNSFSAFRHHIVGWTIVLIRYAGMEGCYDIELWDERLLKHGIVGWMLQANEMIYDKLFF